MPLIPSGVIALFMRTVLISPNIVRKRGLYCTYISFVKNMLKFLSMVSKEYVHLEKSFMLVTINDPWQTSYNKFHVVGPVLNACHFPLCDLYRERKLNCMIE